MVTAKNVAEYFLKLSNPEYGDYMSNLRLQKLVYYAQGFHLATYDMPLFCEPIVAWNYGPVVENLYHEYKKYRSGVIPPPSDPDFGMFSKGQIDLMNEVSLVYGQFSALKLMELTHQEPPWKSTNRGEEIPHDIMRRYFKTRLRK